MIPKTPRPPELATRQLIKHAGLFILTFLTTAAAGMIWQNVTDFMYFSVGILYAVAVLFILTCHEFGHYFAARYHGIRTTLPYYIPLPPVVSIVNFGTLGAVIRTKQQIPGRKELFDIGIAGPIAGFIASCIVLAIGFMTLPGHDFLLGIHPDFDFSTGSVQGDSPGLTLTFGSTILYSLFSDLFARPGAYIPPMTEMYHYPLLISGWFGLLVTALNLLPTSQLDGGHVAYAMFGNRHGLIARVTVALLVFMGGMGVLPSVLEMMDLSVQAERLMSAFGNFEAIFWPGWLFWALLIGVFMKVDHPSVPNDEPLDGTRFRLGWSAYAMFIVCVSPAPVFVM